MAVRRPARPPASAPAPEPAPFVPTYSHLAAAPPVLRRREVWLDIHDEIPDESYLGLRVLVYTNFPTYLIQELQARREDGTVDDDRLMAAIAIICIRHNGWVKEDGTPYPPIGEPAFWDEIPPEVAGAIVAFVNRTARRLPKSPETATPTANG